MRAHNNRLVSTNCVAHVVDVMHCFHRLPILCNATYVLNKILNLSVNCDALRPIALMHGIPGCCLLEHSL